MRFENISIQRLRNHSDTSLALSPGINIFVGANGQGKTSVLEALSYLSLTTTFVPSSNDAAAIQRGGQTAFVAADYVSDVGMRRRLEVTLSASERKLVTDGSKRISAVDVIGRAPIVVLSPDFKTITSGTPADRRKFADSVLSQGSRRYLESAMKHKKVLKQRNALLSEMRETGRAELTESLVYWTDLFCSVSAELVHHRLHFVRDFSVALKELYTQVVPLGEEVSVTYSSEDLSSELLSPAVGVEEITRAYSSAAQKVRAKELARGSTGFGPQRDDFDFWINGGLVRETASQGQHKSLLIAIKAAEHRWLHAATDETPAILLDDVFAELDRARAANVLDLIRSSAQTFITTTELTPLRALIDNQVGSIFEVTNGIARLQ